METEEKIAAVLDHYGITITHDFDDFNNVEYVMYSDITRDSYDLYVAKFNHEPSNGSLYLSEHVCMYNYDLCQIFIQEIRRQGMEMYIEDDIYIKCHFEEVLEDEFYYLQGFDHEFLTKYPIEN
jgi:hypothetical protein